MRSKRLGVGVALSALALAALLTATFAPSSNEANHAIVGAGKASATKSACGAGTGKRSRAKPLSR